MSLGFKRAGFLLAAAVDNNPINVAIHKRNFAGCSTIDADLTCLSAQELLQSTGRSSSDEIAVLFGDHRRTALPRFLRGWEARFRGSS